MLFILWSSEHCGFKGTQCWSTHVVILIITELILSGKITIVCEASSLELQLKPQIQFMPRKLKVW